MKGEAKEEKEKGLAVVERPGAFASSDWLRAARGKKKKKKKEMGQAFVGPSIAYQNAALLGTPALQLHQQPGFFPRLHPLLPVALPQPANNLLPTVLLDLHVLTLTNPQMEPVLKVKLAQADVILSEERQVGIWNGIQVTGWFGGRRRTVVGVGGWEGEMGGLRGNNGDVLAEFQGMVSAELSRAKTKCCAPESE